MLGLPFRKYPKKRQDVFLINFSSITISLSTHGSVGLSYRTERKHRDFNEGVRPYWVSHLAGISILPLAKCILLASCRKYTSHPCKALTKKQIWPHYYLKIDKFSNNSVSLCLNFNLYSTCIPMFPQITLAALFHRISLYPVWQADSRAKILIPASEIRENSFVQPDKTLELCIDIKLTRTGMWHVKDFCLVQNDDSKPVLWFSEWGGFACACCWYICLYFWKEVKT